MAETYSIDQARAEFDELIQKVQRGERVVIASHGQDVAEIAPARPPASDISEILRRAEERGLLTRASSRTGKFRPIADRPSALARFLRSRQ
jgi:prevent-host-death family protein